jgi:hypothetical protein
MHAEKTEQRQSLFEGHAFLSLNLRLSSTFWSSLREASKRRAGPIRRLLLLDDVPNRRGMPITATSGFHATDAESFGYRLVARDPGCLDAR